MIKYEKNTDEPIITSKADKFGRNSSLKLQQEFAGIISWYIFQMDDIKYTVPMSCKYKSCVTPDELTLFWENPDTVEKFECEGCKLNRPLKHNGKYVKIMDWTKEKKIKFVDITKRANNE